VKNLRSSYSLDAKNFKQHYNNMHPSDKGDLKPGPAGIAIDKLDEQ